jgi:signal transduction histidine kinase
MDNDIQDATVLGDRQLLGRAISNLITNSIRHNPKGCTIEVALGKYDPFYSISVTDDGVGFPAKINDALNRMEDPQESSGIGLGLTIVYQIVKAHGGRLAARNLADAAARLNYIYLSLSIEFKSCCAQA